MARPDAGAAARMVLDVNSEIAPRDVKGDRSKSVLFDACRLALFVWLISHQPTVLFSQNKPATSNQPAVLFSHNKSAPAISHQPSTTSQTNRPLSRLELQLHKRWCIIRVVRVEMVCYAANKCRSNFHAKQLSGSGELLTVVWFLMAHLGVGGQYRIEAGHARAKLIVEKN
jgi:hypothetical protein